MIADLQMFWRFAAGLRRFLARPLSADECDQLLVESLANRNGNFLGLLRRAVYDSPRSPWKTLLLHAKAEFADIESLVHQRGIEEALEQLRAAGVSVSLEEFKGNIPIARPGLELPVSHGDFDNPLLLREFTVMSGGSGGKRRRLAVDLELLVFEAATQHLFLSAHGLLHRPLALWRPVPPGSSGIKHCLRSAKLGLPVDAWFDLGAGNRTRPWQSAVFLHTAIWQGLRHGRAIPSPVPLPANNPLPVVRWLADAVAKGSPGVLSCPASIGVRVARCAIENCIPIDGSVFWLGGEPITPAKAGVIAEAGASTVNGWSLSETGPIGVGCARREHPDEIHLLHSKVAAIPAEDPTREARSLEAPPAGEPVRLLLTTLLPATPKILLNVDIGDRACLSKRPCGCPVEAAGFPLHAHTIHADGKLTAGGMQFLQSDLAALTEVVLPGRFGGTPGDYQFVEEDQCALPVVWLRVNPGVGSVDEDALLATVMDFLGAKSRGNAMMVRTWVESGILRVKRGLPHVSPAGKIPPLWVNRRA